MKTSPWNGSARRTCCTRAASPSMPLRKSTGRAERDLHPARRPGRCRLVLRDHHGYERGSLACCRSRELLAPDEELARVQSVAPRHRRDRRRGVETLGHDPGLLLVGPAPATPVMTSIRRKPSAFVLVVLL